jgi:hypothetical protein
MKKLSVFCLAVLIATGAHAQQAAPTAAVPGSPPPLPSGPLLKPVPDNTRWTVTSAAKVAPNAKPEEKAATSTTIMGEVSGKAAHVLTVKATGGKEEQWTDGKLLATMDPGAKEPIFTTAAIDKIPMPTWVSAENFAEIKSQGKKDYLIFRTQVVPAGTEIIQNLENPGQNDIEKLKVDAVATIDADTRLPVAMKEGETITTYRFEPLAPDTQIIPAAIQAALAERGRKMQDAVRKPVRP